MISVVVEAGLALSRRRKKGFRRSLRVEVSRTRRNNASARAKHQGAQGSPGAARGHAALRWDAQVNRANPEGVVTHRCPTCGKKTVSSG